ncbi:hypothetical protein ARMGADRAFT_1092865 [Armillaria gallica]|uniref:Uncharacterized protein n=1 Tax=Armillaria gallica TaxID=47427 RepID=A0A2H3CEC2_ARMGA|nr:hypothetical protein ARMGADRAFT_1092865 [Armillaria gallica]
MAPFSPLPLTLTPTQDMFTHAADTLLPNLTTLQDPPNLVILPVLSRPLIDMSMTFSTLIYAEFCPTMTPKSLLSSVHYLCFTFSSVGKCMEENILFSAIIVCPAIEELKIEGEGGEECWCSIVSYFKSL